MRILLVVQLVDEREWLRSFILDWIRTLAARVERLDVITLELGEAELPANVFVQSMGKERGYGRVREVIEYYRALGRVIRDVDAVITHMTPRYAWLAAPFTRVFRKPLMLWYTHPHVSPELRFADALSSHILTASPGSYPLKSGKVRVMGHGIEPAQFPLSEGESSPPAVIYVGRLSRIKGQDRLLRALALVAKRPDIPPFCVQLVGGPIATEREYPDQLAALADELAPVPVTFTGPLARPELVPVINDCAVAVNFSPPGSFDKAALESMLVGKPTLVMNADFLPVLGPAAEQLYLPYEADDKTLADRLAALLALSPAERAALGGELRERVVAQHSLDSLMDSIVDVIAEAVKT